MATKIERVIRTEQRKQTTAKWEAEHYACGECGWVHKRAEVVFGLSRCANYHCNKRLVG